jgi:transcriptional regulator with XRE-family HTH domain
MYVVMDGERVEAMRQERGLSRHALAQEAGISPSTVANAERGGVVRLRTVRRVSRVLGVPPKSLGRAAERE